MWGVENKKVLPVYVHALLGELHLPIFVHLPPHTHDVVACFGKGGVEFAVNQTRYVKSSSSSSQQKGGKRSFNSFARTRSRERETEMGVQIITVKSFSVPSATHTAHERPACTL